MHFLFQGCFGLSFKKWTGLQDLQEELAVFPVVYLKVGRINNRVALKRMVFIRDGKVIREQEFGHTQGYTLQLLVPGQRIVEVQLIDEVVYRSNYNQMFLLGRFKEELFEETYNAFPLSRLFRVKF